jgi:hypothetical protein
VPSARSSRARPAYRPPSALNDLHILDVLELSESQGRAAAALQVNQSTVSRSLQLMRREYRLTPGQRQQVCRHGHNPCVHYLRLAYREHRLMAGLLRIGSDVLHNTLLHGMPGVLQVRSLLEEAILHSSRSRGGGKICRHYICQHSEPNYNPQLASHLHRRLIAYGDHLVHRCNCRSDHP